MNVLNKIKDIEINFFKWVIGILVTISITGASLTIADQNKKIDNKVDNITLQEMIKRLEEKDKTTDKQLDRQYDKIQTILNEQKDLLKIVIRIQQKIDKK